MGRQDKHKEREMERLIAEYITMNAGAEDTVAVQDYVENQMGHRPSKGMVLGVFVTLGLQWQAGRWVRGV